MKTTIEWLVEQLARKHNEFQALTFYYDHKEEIEQAKAMEKEQIADAFRNGSTSSMLGGGHWTQYYNQTYNK